MTDTSATHRVVVIGGGFGGLFATQALRRTPAEVVLIDRTGHHLFQPLLYQVATGILSEGQITRPLRVVLRRQHNAKVVVGEVDGIDLASRHVSVASFGTATTIAYDSLIVAAGAGYSYFGHDEFVADAPGLKSVDDALELRARIFTAFERAEAARDETERRRHLTFAVIGGGPTGIEMAGQIRDLAQRSLRHDYDHIHPQQAHVVLLEASTSLLPTYGRRLSEKTLAALTNVGVDVRLGSRVVDVSGDAVVFAHGGSTTRLEASTKIWAAGVTAASLSDLLSSQADVETNHAGQLLLEPDCTLPGYPEVFVVGDLMDTRGVPGVAQLAIQSGRYAAHTITRRLRGRATTGPFAYRDKGSVATIARFQAVANVKGVRLSGLPAWLFWLAIHLWTVMGFGRRLSVALRWTFAFTADRRPERVATTRQAHWPAGDLTGQPVASGRPLALVADPTASSPTVAQEEKSWTP